mgnify:CR=1 FL=1
MAGYRLSSKAAEDIESIYEFTVLRFGLGQARNYLNALEERFDLLAQSPGLGRPAEDLAPGLRASMLDLTLPVLFRDVQTSGWLLPARHPRDILRETERRCAS